MGLLLQSNRDPLIKMTTTKAYKHGIETITSVFNVESTKLIYETFKLVRDLSISCPDQNARNKLNEVNERLESVFSSDYTSMVAAINAAEDIGEVASIVKTPSKKEKKIPIPVKNIKTKILDNISNKYEDDESIGGKAIMAKLKIVQTKNNENKLTEKMVKELIIALLSKLGMYVKKAGIVNRESGHTLVELGFKNYDDILDREALTEEAEKNDNVKYRWKNDEGVQEFIRMMSSRK